MIIDNIFSIKTYSGSQPLPLFNAPSSLSTSAAYTTFINNISTIYGTQAVDGSIPTFYKTGNTPDARSSLRSLDPQQAYYFISKADSVLPYNIPFSGSILPSPYKNCPTLDLLPSRVLLTASSGNYYYLINDVGNLNIAYPYTYEVKVLSTNWRVSTLTPSGTVASSQPTNAIISALRFDSDNGADLSTFLPQNTSVSQVDKNQLFAIVEVSLTPPSDSGCSKIIDLMLLQCNNCIPAPTPTPTLTPTPTPTPVPPFSNIMTIAAANNPVTSNGIVFNTISTGDTFEFSALSSTSGGPQTMNLYISGSIVGLVNFPSDYIGRPFRFTKFSSGIRYNGIFTNGNINL